MIKVDVISGFLGAGKTTLIKKLYSEIFKNEKVVLIENEFGEIGIDGAFLKDSGVEIKEINSGCICCSLVGDFSSSMKEVIAKFSPERIIIEPSGVGKLSDIIKAIDKVDEHLKLNVIVTVVDGGKCKMYHKNFGEFYNDQVENANVVVVSKTEKLTDEKIIDCASLIKSINGEALIVTTPVENLDGVKLLKTFENISDFRNNFIWDNNECRCGCHGHDHEHHNDHECGCHGRDHEHHHDHECGCHGHDHEHHHDHECGCHGHDHEHHHDHECGCHGHDHEHHHDHECGCHGHDHEHHHDHECGCHGHDHEHHHDHECGCHGHDHEHHHDHECGCHEHDHEHHHHADEVFTSWGVETAKSFTKDELETILTTLCADNADLGLILRSKGVVKAKDCDKWYYFDLVSGEFEIRFGEPEVTGKLCVIGSKNK